MLAYRVANAREEAVTVDGLDVLPAGATRVYDQTAADMFAFTRGLKLSQVGLPDDVELTVVVMGGE